MTSEITSPATNIELLRAAFEAFNAGDADKCMAFTTPDLIMNLAELPEPRHGQHVWREGFEMMKQAFPDLQAQIEDIVAADPKAIEQANAVYALLDELAGSAVDDPRVEAAAQQIVASVPEPARRAIRIPDGAFEATDHGFAAAFYADFAPAQAAAIRLAVELMRKSSVAGASGPGEEITS